MEKSEITEIDSPGSDWMSRFTLVEFPRKSSE